MATTGQRATQERYGRSFAYAMKAATAINRGAVAALEAGFLVPGTAAAGLTVVGIATDSIRNDGADGDTLGTVKRGAFLLGNSTGDDLITPADVGTDCYLVDDETVAKTDGGGTRSRAGLVSCVDAAGVWVEIDGRKSGASQ